MFCLEQRFELFDLLRLHFYLLLGSGSLLFGGPAECFLARDIFLLVVSRLCFLCLRPEFLCSALKFFDLVSLLLQFRGNHFVFGGLLRELLLCLFPCFLERPSLGHRIL